jgi:hypothetical protein
VAIRVQMNVETASLEDIYLTSESGEQSADTWPFNSATLVCVKRKVFYNPVKRGRAHALRGAPRLDGQRYNSRGSESCPGLRGGTMVFWSALPCRIFSSESLSHYKDWIIGESIPHYHWHPRHSAVYILST